MPNNSDAQRTYGTMCRMLDNINWKYNRDDANLVITTGAVGNDLSMQLRIVVSADRNVMYIKSPMPFTVPAAKMGEMSYAVNIANYSMLNGCFELDIYGGYLGFKAVVPFAESIISEEVCKYLVMLVCTMADKFNDKFKDLIEDKMSLEQFRAFTNG